MTIEADYTALLVTHQPAKPRNREELARMTALLETLAMNETEAMTYCTYVREGFAENENRGLVGMTLGFSLAALLVTFGAFYLYYNRKY